MANPFISFKNRYAGTDTVAEKLSATASAQIEDAYEALYNAIYKELSMARKEVNYATVARQTQLLKQIGVELDKFKTRYGSYLLKALKKIAEYGTKVAIRDLDLLAGGTTRADQWHYDYNRDYAEQTFKDNFEHIAAQTDRIKKSVKQQLRADSALIFRRAAVEGWSRRKATTELMSQIDKTIPAFQFVDKRGRAWDSKTYFDMLAKTVMASTLNEVYTNSLINEGHDLVKVNVNGAKDACRKWEGKVLSLTGASNGYTTVAQAKATGEVFHPRCKHRLLVYEASIDDVFQAVEDGKSDEEILGKLK